MKKWLIGCLIAIVAIAVGVGGAYAFNRVYPVQKASIQQNLPRGIFPNMGSGNYYYGNRNGMMPNNGQNRQHRGVRPTPGPSNGPQS
jgi:hypothetical protein